MVVTCTSEDQRPRECPDYQGILDSLNLVHQFANVTVYNMCVGYSVECVDMDTLEDTSVIHTGSCSPFSS